MLLGIIGILAWGWGSSHKVHGHDLKKMTSLLKQFEQMKSLLQNLSKLIGVLKIRHQYPISAIEQMKWMQYQNISRFRNYSWMVHVGILKFFLINIIFIF
jgi:hypothetical protein